MMQLAGAHALIALSRRALRLLVLQTGQQGTLIFPRLLKFTPNMAQPTLRIIDRYLARELLVSFIGATAILLLVTVGGNVADLLNKIARGKIPAELLFSLIGLHTVEALTVLAPLAVFIGVQLGYGRLYRESEMAVFSASGLSVTGLLRPLMLLTVPLMVVMALISFWWAPAAGRLSQVLVQEANRSLIIAGLEPGRFVPLPNNDGMMYVESMNEDGTKFKKMFVISERAGVLAKPSGASTILTSGGPDAVQPARAKQVSAPPAADAPGELLIANTSSDQIAAADSGKSSPDKTRPEKAGSNNAGFKNSGTAIVSTNKYPPGVNSETASNLPKAQTAAHINVITAADGELFHDANGAERYLGLNDGFRVEGNIGEDNYRLLRYARNDLKLTDSDPDNGSDAAKLVAPTLDLWRSRDPVQRAELHWRLAAPLSTLVLVLLALPLSKSSPRQPRYAGLLIALLSWSIYFSLLSLGRNSIRSGGKLAALGLWWVYIPTLAIALYLLWRSQQLPKPKRSPQVVLRGAT